MFINPLIYFLMCHLSSKVYGQGGKFTHIESPKYVRTPALSCADIKYIVDFHNDARRSLANGTLMNQPKAGNMQKVTWDERLAEIARNWTMKMIFSHNPERNDHRFNKVGENLFMTASTNIRSTKVEWIRPLNGWFYEHNFYKFRPTCEDPVTAHYTQMIWADVTHIGCGTTHFLDTKNWLYKYYVCNYGPAGNWYDSFPYEEAVNTENEMDILISLGLMDFQSEINIPDDLSCDFNQCGAIYGPNCTQ